MEDDFEINIDGTSRPFEYNPENERARNSRRANNTGRARNRHRFVFIDPNEMFKRFFGGGSMFDLMDQMTR